MKVNFIAKKTLIIALTALTIASCSDENENLINPEMSNSNEVEASTDDDVYVERFTIDDKGNKVPITNGSKNIRQRRPTYYHRSDMTINDLNRYNIKAGKRHAFNRLHILAEDGTNRPSRFVNYNGNKNSRKWGIAIAQRHYGYISSQRNKNWFKKYLPKLKRVGIEYRTVETANYNTPIGGPEILQQVTEAGRKDKQINLHDSKTKFTFIESKAKTVEHGTTVGASVTVTAEAGVIFSSVSTSATVSFDQNFKDIRNTTTSRTSEISYNRGHVVPKGKKCVFEWSRRKIRNTRKYKVYLKVYGGLLVTHPMRGVHENASGYKWFYSTNGAYSIFDKRLKDGRKSFRNFTSTSEFYNYEIRRRNCWSL